MSLLNDTTSFTRKYRITKALMLTSTLLMDGSLMFLLLMGKVNHSYAVNQTPLKPWVAIRNFLMVECGHSDSMAGLVESCFHVNWGDTLLAEYSCSYL